MNLPQPGEYIDIHIHGGTPSLGKFIVESLMAHEDKIPQEQPGIAYTFGIHPWFLTGENQQEQLIAFERMVERQEICAIGEAGFDRLRGPSWDLQRSTFEKQASLAEELHKPVIIHCVRAWDELLLAHKKLRPKMPWLVHGFRGNAELAAQLLSKGLYLSLWFEFALRPESSSLLKVLPVDRIFLETDGANVDIKDIYEKISLDLDLPVQKLINTISSNFFRFFDLNKQ